MKKAGKIVALIACVCLVLGVFAGCSGDTPMPITTPTNSPKAGRRCNRNGNKCGVPAV